MINRTSYQLFRAKSHMMFLDGAYVVSSGGPMFRRVPAPSRPALERLVQAISHRVGAYLTRQRLLMRDIVNSYLQLEALEGSDMDDLLGHPITDRIAVGPQAGRKAFTLQTMPAQEQQSSNNQLAKANGFSLHTGVSAKDHQRRKLERLCRYIARPAVATDRLALTRQGNVRYTLKTPYRDGTTHIILEPLDFVARLAALVPEPRVNLTRYHGVFAPNNRLRSDVPPARYSRQDDETKKNTSRKQTFSADFTALPERPVLAAVAILM